MTTIQDEYHLATIGVNRLRELLQREAEAAKMRKALDAAIHLLRDHPAYLKAMKEIMGDEDYGRNEE